MKKIFSATMTLIVTSFFMACGDQGTVNKPANAGANNTNAATSTAPVNTSAIEADIKKLITDYAASTTKNDVSAFDKTTTDNFMFVSNDGSVQTKAERIASLKSGDTKYETLTYEDVAVRVNAEGNGAIAIGKAAVKMINLGKPLDAVVRVTQVWSKTKDGWKMASLQATNITAKADDKSKTDGEGKDDKSKSEAPKTQENK